MTPCLDERLRQVIAGDRRAMAWLYETVAPTLWRRLRERYEYPGGLEAEELLHDAFVYFLKRDARVLQRFLEKFPTNERHLGSLRRYLWNLACGVASNHRRSAKHRQTQVQAGDTWESADTIDEEQQRLDRDTLRRLAACLRSKRRQLYLYYQLRYLDGLTPREIVDATGWSQRLTYRLRQELNHAVRDCAAELEIGDG